jgi:hypothetical protein
MDKKKKIIIGLSLSLFFIWASPIIKAQTPNAIQFGNESHKYDINNDSITFFLKVLDENGKRMTQVEASDLEEHFTLIEDQDTVPRDRWEVNTLTEGQRIPADFTISVLVDLNIPKDGKKQIFNAVASLVESANDSCVYLSFFGDDVTQSQLVTKQNCKDFEGRFKNGTENKCFYSALYGKLSEFEWVEGSLKDSIKWEDGYDDQKNEEFKKRVQNGEGKNLLFVFTESSILPDIEEIDFPAFVDYNAKAVYAPKVFAFFYDAGNGISEDMESTLQGVTEPRDADHDIIPNRQGFYMPSNSIDSVVNSFKQVVRNEMYDFALTYKVPDKKIYSGGAVNYEALWDGQKIGLEAFSIGTPENPWPKRPESTGDSFVKYLIALLVTLATIVLFIIIMKILIPGVKSRVFSTKYYKPYKPVALSENVKNVKLKCPLCRTEIMPGDKVVTKCKHIMHVKCWKSNEYKCVEYGQNCKEGIQEHIHWKELFGMGTVRDCYLAIMGIMAGLVSWIIYELSGRGLFKSIATGIVTTFFGNEAHSLSIVSECVNKVSSFLTIGLLLAFFLSLIFRYYDGIKRKDWKSLLKIVGLSILSSAIGMAAFALGSIILCLCLSPESTNIPWYYSFPAYLLFSLCTSLSLTIKSTIPIKSALLGGLASAVIGFLVLYFSSVTNKRGSWLNMLLDFVIYGGGLGASLVTVRMLAEKYFLVIKDGIKAGTKIPIHKWMNANGGGHKVTIGMTQQCEIMMNWEKSNKVAKEHVQLYIDHAHSQTMMKPLAFTVFNTRTELNSNNKPVPLFNNDTFKIGDTTFQYVEN